MQIRGVRQALLDKGWNLARNGRIAALNVGTVVERCHEVFNLEIQFINLEERHDPSHTGIYGLPQNGIEQARLLAASVNPAEVYPAG